MPHEIVGFKQDSAGTIKVTVECIKTRYRIVLYFEEEYRLETECPACEEKVKLMVKVVDE